MSVSGAAPKAVNFEKDEEFNDFAASEWKVAKVSKAALWVEEWDGDDTSDQVSQDLRAAIQKIKESKAQQQQQQQQ